MPYHDRYRSRWASTPDSSTQCRLGPQTADRSLPHTLERDPPLFLSAELSLPCMHARKSNHAVGNLAGRSDPHVHLVQGSVSCQCTRDNTITAVSVTVELCVCILSEQALITFGETIHYTLRDSNSQPADIQCSGENGRAPRSMSSSRPGYSSVANDIGNDSSCLVHHLCSQRASS